MPLLKARIRETALALLKARPEGLRYSILHGKACEALPDISPNTVASELHSLRHALPDGCVKKGLYRHPDHCPPAS